MLLLLCTCLFTVYNNFFPYSWIILDHDAGCDDNDEDHFDETYLMQMEDKIVVFVWFSDRL